MQKKAIGGGVAQLIKFRPGQFEKMVFWLKENQLGNKVIFKEFFAEAEKEEYNPDNDVDAIKILYLTMNEAYREFPQRKIAVKFLMEKGFPSSPLVPQNISEFANYYKQFVHLWKRSDKTDQMGILMGIGRAMLNLHTEIGETAHGMEGNGNKASEDENYQSMAIQKMAASNSLKFRDLPSATSHYLKHGTNYNKPVGNSNGRGSRVTGMENSEMLKKGFSKYIEQANLVIQKGKLIKREEVLGGFSFHYEMNAFKAIVAFDPVTSLASIATFYPDENMDYVNDGNSTALSQSQESAWKQEEVNNFQADFPMLPGS